jgi:hypothetical protein
VSATSLRRALPLIEMAALVLYGAYLWVSDRRRRLRWRAEGAIDKWESAKRPKVKRGARGRRTNPR